MEYIYAALLLHKAKKEINETNMKKVLEAAGITPDEAIIKTTIASLKGVDIDKAMQEAVVVPTAHVPGATPTKEEKKQETREEETTEGLAALFG